MRALIPILAAVVGCVRSTPTVAPPPLPVDTAAPVTGDTAPPVDTDDTDDTDVEPAPTPPPGLTRWLTGADQDVDVAPLGPALILMGGGAEPDAAFTWWIGPVAGGDVVVLRTSGEDGYNDYLYAQIGGVDSVETLRVDTPMLANDPYVRWRIEHAEGLFFAGGDQTTYVDAWRGTGLEDAVHAAWARGAVIGGTSAGLAILGDRVFTASNGTVYSWEALEDPYNDYMTFEDDFLNFDPLAGWVTDSHFAERDRLGRLVTFLARMQEDGLQTVPVGIGVDEATALLVGSDGQGTVVGDGAVYVLRTSAPASVCDAGVPLTMDGVERVRLVAGDTVHLPSGVSPVGPLRLSVVDGVIDPPDPYAP